jgi:hypothetical protein
MRWWRWTMKTGFNGGDGVAAAFGDVVDSGKAMAR